jgi:hypothetical protein
MTYAFEQEVPITEELYRKIMARLGPEPLEGQLVHLVVRGAGGTLRYIDVWTSKEACDRAFEERIHPAVAPVFKEAGFRPNGEPSRRELDLVEAIGALSGKRGG